MGDGMKSAWEIALEKLKTQDRERGERGPAALSTAQKKTIADVRARCQAKLAEIEIQHEADRRQAAGDADALAKVEEGYLRERRRIEEQRDTAVEKARTGRGKKAT